MSHSLKNTIYLDHAATTPLGPRAREVLIMHLSEYGNPSSMHHLGRRAFDVREGARKEVADTLKVASSECVFTGSGTESDVMAVLGLARAHRKYGDHVIVSSIEHKAVLGAAKVLEKEGFRVTYLPVDEYGRISIAECRKTLTDKTILVSVMLGNNEIGTTEPITELAAVVRERRGRGTAPLLHTDACQAVGLVSVEPRKLGVDAMTINSSKIYGPKGVGLLYLRDGVQLEPLIVGGDQEGGKRAGTENVALMTGFSAALTEAVSGQEEHTKKMNELAVHFRYELEQAVPDIRFNGHPEKRLPHIVHVTIPEIEGESLVLMLSEAGICAATGSACSSLDLEPSYVLSAIGQDENVIHGSLRFSLGRDTTPEELSYTADMLGRIVGRLREITACTTDVYKLSELAA